MDSEADYEPFEKVVENGRTILRLHGTVSQCAEVEADRVSLILNAIVEGWDIDVEYTVIKGDLDIRKIVDELERSKNGRPIIKGNVQIRHSKILGNTYFVFNGGMSFHSTFFGGDVYFIPPSFRGFCLYVFERYLTSYTDLCEILRNLWYRTPRQLKHGFIEHFLLLIFAIYQFFSMLYVSELPLRLIVYVICRMSRRLPLDGLRNRFVRARLRIVNEGSIYLEICLLLSLSMLILPHVYQHDRLLSIYAHRVTVQILRWRLVDILLMTSGTIFLARYNIWGQPASINRSFIILILNYVQIVLCFSIFYLSSRAIVMTVNNTKRLLMCPQESLYFSLVTVTTVGYGDFWPMNDYGRFLVASQILIGFYFVVLIFSSFVQMFSRNSRDSDCQNGNRTYRQA